jgi:hypothetical protein
MGNGISFTPGVTLSGAENGTETFTDPGANMRRMTQNIAGGDGGDGPARVGIFATPSPNTRAAAGASYWGVLNLSDNVGEYYYSVCSRTKQPLARQWHPMRRWESHRWWRCQYPQLGHNL